MRRIRLPSAALLMLLAAVALLGLPPSAAQDRSGAALLVAKPGLTDPNFSETVVLVTQDAGAVTPGGTAGVIINRPTNRSLASILPGERFARYTEPVFFGGPVMNQGLFALYRAGKPVGDSLTMLPGVFLALQPPTLDMLLQNPPQSIRFYSGLSGWAPGQLQAEIERGDWFVLNADPDTVFAPETQARGLWRRLVRMARTITAGIPASSGSIPSISVR